MKLIDNLGYLIKDVEQELGPEQFAAFQRWFVGQTGAISQQGKLLVYPWDYERFLAGLPPLD